jgi:hypothetical protein
MHIYFDRGNFRLVNAPKNIVKFLVSNRLGAFDSSKAEDTSNTVCTITLDQANYLHGEMTSPYRNQIIFKDCETEAKQLGMAIQTQQKNQGRHI